MRISGENRGFTLVEVMVVMAMMGFVVMAIYSLYESTQRSASTQERVVEAQQNLRVAMDRLARDVRMAGFLIPEDLTPLAQAPASPIAATPLKLRTASATGDVARISEEASFTNSDQADVIVADAEMVDLFDSGTDGDFVRVIRTPDRSQPVDEVFQVISKNRTARRLRLKCASTVTAQYVPGDLIVKTAETASDPNEISYFLDETEHALKRTANNRTEPVASDITTFKLSYLLEDGTEVENADVPDERLGEIRAIRVVLTWTAITPDQDSKDRRLTSVIPIKNL